MARSWRSSVTEGNGLRIGWLGLGDLVSLKETVLRIGWLGLGDLVSLKDGFGWERI